VIQEIHREAANKIKGILKYDSENKQSYIVKIEPVESEIQEFQSQ
jgi:hypothetical protein